VRRPRARIEPNTAACIEKVSNTAGPYAGVFWKAPSPSSSVKARNGVSDLAKIFEALCVQRIQEVLLRNGATLVDVLTCVRCSQDTAPYRLFRFGDATLCAACYGWLFREESPRVRAVECDSVDCATR